MSGLGTDVIVERADPLTGEEFLTWAALVSEEDDVDARRS